MEEPAGDNMTTKILSEKLAFSTEGNCDIVNITVQVADKLRATGLSTGTVNVFVPGATGAITTTEYEPGMVRDLKNLFGGLIPEQGKYSHDAGNPAGNAPSHLRASLVGPSLVVPFENGTLQLGKFQQIIFIDFDNRPRKREIILRILGE
jgi:secondary thiamine-phosphate synthase enzyme